MAEIKNEVTSYLHKNRGMTLSGWARMNGLSPTSVRNTIYGIRPIKKVVEHMFLHDSEIYELLPSKSKDLIKKL